MTDRLTRAVVVVDVANHSWTISVILDQVEEVASFGFMTNTPGTVISCVNGSGEGLEENDWKRLLRNPSVLIKLRISCEETIRQSFKDLLNRSEEKTDSTGDSGTPGEPHP